MVRRRWCGGDDVKGMMWRGWCEGDDTKLLLHNVKGMILNYCSVCLSTMYVTDHILLWCTQLHMSVFIEAEALEWLMQTTTDLTFLLSYHADQVMWWWWLRYECSQSLCYCQMWSFRVCMGHGGQWGGLECPGGGMIVLGNNVGVALTIPTSMTGVKTSRWKLSMYNSWSHGALDYWYRCMWLEEVVYCLGALLVSITDIYSANTNKWHTGVCL